MKMDARDQGHMDHQSYDPFHYVPLPFNDTPPPAPARPQAHLQTSPQEQSRGSGVPVAPFLDTDGDVLGDDQDGSRDRSESRDVVPFYFDSNLPAPTVLDSERRRQHARDLISCDIDIRFASAREISAVSLEMYVRGLLTWDEYARLAFQPELHPDYNATIGALLGSSAEPDKPQDFVRFWEERLAYERRYKVADAKQLRETERITLVMRRLAGISSLRA